MIQIYGTMGPRCCSREVFEQMLSEGLNGIRLNLSHTSLELSRDRIENFTRACESAGVEKQLMIDLHGPGQRVGMNRKEMEFQEGDLCIVKNKRTLEEHPVIPVPTGITSALEAGDRLLIHDGFVSAEVLEELEPQIVTREVPGEKDDTEDDAAPRTEEVVRRRFLCRILRGGRVRPQQSVKIEGKEVYGPVLTKDDMTNLDMAEAFGVTAVMQPFVRNGADVQVVRDALDARGLHARIFAKIETLTGVENLDSIMDVADVIVIARGDLGNCGPLWELPALQKRIAQACRQRNKPFMVVTQMLTSMIHSAVPTRAEVSDIFNAVLDGASYLMVTNETSVGSHPDLAVRYLARTAQAAERFMGC